MATTSRTPTKAKTTTKAKTKTKANVKPTTSSKAKLKAKAKPVVSSKKPAAKAPVKKSAVKAAVKKPVAKKPAAKAVMKPVAKKTAPVKAPVKAVNKPVAPVVDTRTTLNRAPSHQNKAPLSSVGRQQQQNGRTMFVVPPQVSTRKNNFSVGEFVVYPTHGVGKIVSHEVERIGEHELKVFVIAFEKDKMILRVPVGRAEAAGLRSISSNDQIGKALATLKGRAKIARGMWSRRAQEYEAKINSGNLVAIAEVVRDLHKNVDQSERSYSERMIYETAMHRLCGEVAASEKVDVKDAQDRLLKVLRKQAAMAA